MNVVRNARTAKPLGRLISEHEVLEDYFPEECRPVLGWIREKVPHALRIGDRPYFNREDVEDVLCNGKRERGARTRS